MAYIKSFTNKAGFTGSYWRLTGIEINKFSNSIDARISCYKDAASRASGLSPFAHKEYALKLSDVDMSKDVQSEVYKLLKTAKTKSVFSNETPFFADAVSDEL